MTLIIDDITVHSDDRGVVFEPIVENSLVHQRNAHIIISRPGAVRGNHYHKNKIETLVVMGPALVRIRENDDIRDIVIPPERIYRFIIPPKVSHAIKNTGDQPNIAVAFTTLRYDPDSPDVVRDILFEK